MLYYALQLSLSFYFNVWNPNSKFCLDFFKVQISDRKSVWNTNCLDRTQLYCRKSKLVQISDIHCILKMVGFWNVNKWKQLFFTFSFPFFLILWLFPSFFLSFSLFLWLLSFSFSLFFSFSCFNFFLLKLSTHLLASWDSFEHDKLSKQNIAKANFY